LENIKVPFARRPGILEKVAFNVSPPSSFYIAVVAASVLIKRECCRPLLVYQGSCSALYTFIEYRNKRKSDLSSFYWLRKSQVLFLTKYDSQ
jgi:hypothetical protein